MKVHDESLISIYFTLAPSAFKSTLLSRLIDAGIVRMSSYPLAAATIARPIPVLPEVGSTKTVFPVCGILSCQCRKV